MSQQWQPSASILCYVAVCWPLNDAPDIVVERIEICKIRRPQVQSDMVVIVVSQPLLGDTDGVSGS